MLGFFFGPHWEPTHNPAAASNQNQTTKPELNGEEMWGLLWDYT